MRKEGEREENETERGLRVTDAGFLNTAVISSKITYIDGDAGSEFPFVCWFVVGTHRVWTVLRYRGYPIEQLATHSNFLEVSYLLIYGELPTRTNLQTFQHEVMHHSVVHSDAEELFRSFRYNAHPMAMMSSAFSALGSFYEEVRVFSCSLVIYTYILKRGRQIHLCKVTSYIISLCHISLTYSSTGQKLFTQTDPVSLANMDKQIYRLIGKAITLAAMAYRVRQGRAFVTPPTGLSYTASFLYMLDKTGEERYKPSPVLERALDILFILHADHELNASATTVLQTGSSLVDPYSAVAAGCSSLYGPLHGGANEAVIRMLLAIGSPANVPAYIEAVKKREKVLSGFGHRWVFCCSILSSSLLTWNLLCGSVYKTVCRLLNFELSVG